MDSPFSSRISSPVFKEKNCATLLLLCCAISYVIHVHKRSLANAITAAGVKVIYGSFQLHFNLPLGIIFLGTWSGKGERRGISHLLVAFHQQQRLHQERWFWHRCLLGHKCCLSLQQYWSPNPNLRKKNSVWDPMFSSHISSFAVSSALHTGAVLINKGV